MKFIDTHVHLYANAFTEDRSAAMERAQDVGVDLFLLPNIDSTSIEPMLQLEAAHPQRCLPMMGLHPTSVKESVEEELRIVQSYLDERPWVAVGEIGIDLYWDKTYYEQQRVAFLRQAEWAIAADRPIVIHSRESIDLLIDLIQSMQEPSLRGVFHCFTGDRKQAEAILELGFYLGIGGVVTFKNGGLDRSLPGIPLDRLLLETDAPYLAPTPHRGKRNESSYIPLIANKLAEIMEVDVATIARQTTDNAYRLFEPERFGAPPM